MSSQGQFARCSNWNPTTYVIPSVKQFCTHSHARAISSRGRFTRHLRGSYREFEADEAVM